MYADKPQGVVDEGTHDGNSLPGQEEPDEATLGWEGPRWRQPEAAAQGVVELERRFRNTAAPRQRGVINGDEAIARDAAPLGRRPSASSGGPA